MAQTDSLDKIFGSYISSVCSESFSYKDKLYYPKPLQVSPLIFRGYTCPAMCGGCCPRFSLDYLPPHTDNLEINGRAVLPRIVTVNGQGFVILSDMQFDHNEHHCHNLSQKDGRCNIHEQRPFSCNFELIRFITREAPDQPNLLMSKLFGRGWAMLRMDGERGARCEMTAADEITTADIIRKLHLLEEWCDHFKIANKVSTVIEWCSTGPHTIPLYIE